MSGRGRFLLGRALWALVMILVVVTFNFFLFRVLPGDPAKAGMHDPRLSPAVDRRADASASAWTSRCSSTWRAANPLDSQYFAYLGALMRGDLGIELRLPRRAGRGHARRGARQHALAHPARPVLAILFGIALGLIRGLAARHRAGRRVADVQPVHVVAADLLPRPSCCSSSVRTASACRRRAGVPSAPPTTRGRSELAWTSVATCSCRLWPSPWCCWASTC